MKCVQCQANSPPDAKFCPECGTKLIIVCQCGAENALTHKFCAECGKLLIVASGKERVDAPVRTAQEAERRQLTVMFCDLVGSTALSGGLDPEELREIVRAYQGASAEVIERYEGHIAQYLGDGLLVYFGFPRAHEDDPQRAVHAGLGITAAMGALNERLEPEKGISLAVRIGIHTGPVVVGEMGGGGRQENLAMGETPNVAARFQGLANPDAVVISAATYRLVQGFFDFRDMGEHTLKGVPEPMTAYHVLGGSGIRDRLQVARPAGLTLWFLGFPDRALKMSHEAIAMAEELAQPFSLVLAHYFLAQLHQFRQEPALARERAELMIDICNQYSIQHFDSAKDVLVGWSNSAEGRGDEGISAMRAGLDLWRASGAELRGPDYIAVLAEAYGRSGDIAEGLRLAEEAIGFIEKTGERRWKAEVHRLKGVLLSGSVETQGSAEESYRAAIEAARCQSAKTLELRASEDLARLLRGQGKAPEARALLSEIYGWFNEGFDTKDLTEAKILIDELS